jgi:hypothetical protein
LTLACDDPVRQRDDFDILGYSISAHASGVDAVTGEELVCGFRIDQVDTGGPLVGTWMDTSTIHVFRLRRSATQSVTYDTMLTQEVQVTVPDSFHIQVTATGPLTLDLTGEMIPAYPGFSSGAWTCGAEHPLSRVQPDAMLDGQWHTLAIPDLPID